MAMDARSAAILQSVAEREGNSLLHYTYDSYPWTSSERRDLSGRLRTIIEWECRALAPVIRFLQDHRVPVPFLGAYPSDFTTTNYLAMGHLLPLLADDQRRSILALEADLDSVPDLAARPALARLLEAKRRHLVELQGLATTQPTAIRT